MGWGFLSSHRSGWRFHDSNQGSFIALAALASACVGLSGAFSTGKSAACPIRPRLTFESFLLHPPVIANARYLDGNW